jgi:hypothetical protein
VSRLFQVSLGAQGDDRLIFDYEDTHDMIGVIRLAHADVAHGAEILATGQVLIRPP